MHGILSGGGKIQSIRSLSYYIVNYPRKGVKAQSSRLTIYPAISPSSLTKIDFPLPCLAHSFTKYVEAPDPIPIL